MPAKYVYKQPKIGKIEIILRFILGTSTIK